MKSNTEQIRYKKYLAHAHKIGLKKYDKVMEHQTTFRTKTPRPVKYVQPTKMSNPMQAPVQHQLNTFTGRPASLPPYVAPPMASSPTSSPPSITVVDGAGRRASESGSESEHSFSGSRKDRGDYKKSSVLSNLFGRRKKPSQ